MFQSTPHSMNEANRIAASTASESEVFQSTPHSMNEANQQVEDLAISLDAVSIHASLNE